jgi:peptidoglycan hydrolase CwlO-like protein
MDQLTETESLGQRLAGAEAQIEELKAEVSRVNGEIKWLHERINIVEEEEL